LQDAGKNGQRRAAGRQSGGRLGIRHGLCLE
jgi:hypothetical protein